MSRASRQRQRRQQRNISGTNRRDFLKGAIGVGVGVWISAREAYASRSPHEKLNVACVGAGGRGAGNIEGVHAENIVALCDVDEARAAGPFKVFHKAEKFRDYRRMLDKIHKSIDAVVVSTPDHMHAPITLAAMELGKHVYCEKPLTHTIAEARRIGQAARKYKVVTQMGNGGNAYDNLRQTVEIVRSGAIGDVKQVHAWTDRPGHWWTQAMERPSDTPDVPETLEWDLWLGVAPKRPYHPQYVPFQWRGWYDFGTGAMGDMACHICNTAFWALDLRDPAAVEAKTAPRFKETFPAWSIIRWEFPRSGRDKPLEFFWYDGGKQPDPALTAGHELTDNGSIFVGEKGQLYFPTGRSVGPILLPETDFADYSPPTPTIPRVDGRHHQEWIDACKKGEPSDGMSSFPDRAAVMTESLLVGNLAVRTGKRIEWDAKNMRVTNDVPEAQAMIDPEYRTAW